MTENRTPPRWSLAVLLLPFVVVSCQTATAVGAPEVTSPVVAVADDWRLQTIYKGEAGVWYLRIAQVVDQFASPEVLAADDDGRFLVLSVYSGNWTAHECIPDRQWLAPSLPADLDPHRPGRELYAAGQAGSVHQVTLRKLPYARFALESREVGHVAGEEFHAVLAGDLSSEPGDELLAFAISGAVYLLRPMSDAADLVLVEVGDAKGRVRDAVAAELPGTEGTTVLAVSRRGDLLALQLEGAGLTARVILHEDQGLGRIAAARTPGVFYVTRDDGVLLRVAIVDGKVRREPILVTDQGLRGVAAGRFFADGREAVAVYGYNKKVQLVSRVEGGEWQVEDLYTGTQKGHWLVAGELDGRNATDELVASGFDGEVLLLSRPKGYGMDGAAVSEQFAGSK